WQHLPVGRSGHRPPQRRWSCAGGNAGRSTSLVRPLVRAGLPAPAHGVEWEGRFSPPCYLLRAGPVPPRLRPHAPADGGPRPPRADGAAGDLPETTAGCTAGPARTVRQLVAIAGPAPHPEPLDPGLGRRVLVGCEPGH